MTDHDHPDLEHCEKLKAVGWKTATKKVRGRDFLFDAFHTAPQPLDWVLTTDECDEWFPAPSVGELFEELKEPYKTGLIPIWPLIALILNWLNEYKNTDPILANALVDLWCRAKGGKP